MSNGLPSPNQVLGEPKQANKLKLPSPDEVLNSPTKSSGTDYSAILGEKVDENQLENTLNDIVKTSARSISDGEKDMLRDMLNNPNITGEQAKESIQAMQGYHPKQKYNTLTSPDYYVKTDENGVTRPIPLGQGERPPKGYNVANVWGQTKKQGQDDSWYTDLTKSLFNALPSLAMGAADIGNFASLAITGEESELMNRAKNTAESLKMFKDENGGKILYNPEGVKEIGDLVSSERFDLSPESLWNTVNWAAESLPQFLIGAGVAGRGIQGAKALLGVEGALGAAGQKASLFAASTAMQLGENMEAAKEAGLKGREIAQYAGPVSAIQASLDAFTGLDIGATLFSRSYKEASKTMVKDFAKQLTKEADGTLTKESLKKISKEFAVEYGNLSKEYAKVALKDIGGEMLQESLQDVTTKAGQQIWDNLTTEDKAKFGTDATSAASFASYLSNGINSLGVAPVTAISAKNKYIQQSGEALKIVEGGKDKIDEFKANVYQAQRRGDITEAERDHAIHKVDTYLKYQEQTKDLPNLTPEKKKEAFELSYNIEGLKSETDFTEDELKKLDPIAIAKIDSKKELIKGLQKDLNHILLTEDLKQETKAGSSTISKASKEEGIETPEGEKPSLEALRRKLQPKIKKGDKIEFEVKKPEKFVRRNLDDLDTVEVDRLAKDQPTELKAIVQEKLKTMPKAEMDVILTEAQNGRITADMGGNKHIRLGQSVEGKEGEKPNYTFREHLPATKVQFGDRGGDANMENPELPMHYYKEPAVMKRVEFMGKDKKGNMIVKAVLPIYNKESGKFISFAKETKYGNSYYPTKGEQEALERIQKANWLTDDLKEFEYIPKEEREAAAKVEPVKEKPKKESKPLKELTPKKKPVTLKEKREAELAVARQPKLSLPLITDKNALAKKILSPVVNERTGEELGDVEVTIEKKQKDISDKLSKLEQLIKCINK